MTRLAEAIGNYNEHRLGPGEPLMDVRRLAEVSGVHERTVYRHFGGETSMSLSQAVAYARALGCSVEQLYDEDTEQRHEDGQ